MSITTINESQIQSLIFKFLLMEITTRKGYLWAFLLPHTIIVVACECCCYMWTLVLHKGVRVLSFVLKFVVATFFLCIYKKWWFVFFFSFYASIENDKSLSFSFWAFTKDDNELIVIFFFFVWVFINKNQQWAYTHHFFIFFLCICRRWQQVNVRHHVLFLISCIYRRWWQVQVRHHFDFFVHVHL